MRSTAVNPMALVITIGAGLVLVGALVEEVVPTAEHVSPSEGRLPRDTATSLMRHAAVMTVGTTLSRLTGFLRLAAMTAALGVTVSTLGNDLHACQHARRTSSTS